MYVVEPKQNEAGKVVLTMPETTGFYFRELFRELDSKIGEFGIRSYNVRAASLEEVFLKIGSETGKYEEADQIKRQLAQLEGGPYDFKKCRTERTTFGNFGTFCRFQFKTGLASWIGSFITIPLLVLFGVVGVWATSSTRTVQLDMSDWSKIYSSVLDDGTLTIPYNSRTVIGSKSTDDLFSSMSPGLV